MLETCLLVQRHRCRLTAADNRHHLSEAAGSRSLYQFPHKPGTDTPTQLVGADINRILTGKTVRSAVAKLCRIGIADRLSILLGNKKRPAFCGYLQYFLRRFFHGARNGVEARGSCSDMLGVNCGNSLCVIFARRPDNIGRWCEIAGTHAQSLTQKIQHWKSFAVQPIMVENFRRRVPKQRRAAYMLRNR